MDAQEVNVLQNTVSGDTVSGVSICCVHSADWLHMDERARNRGLLCAAQSGCSQCVNKALSAGADVNTSDERLGISPLMEAVCEGHSSCVELTLERGACVNKMDKSGNTALMYALKRRKIDTGNVSSYVLR